MLYPTGMTNWGSVRSTYKDQVKSVEIKNEVTSIINEAFYGCGELSSITIPNSVNSIGGSAFAECKVLSSITIPNRVTSIGNYAFSDCKVLSSITIPASVKTLGADIIQSSTNIKTITFEGEPPELSGFISSFLGDDLASLTAIYVPCTLVEAYKNGEVIASNLRGKIQPKHNPAQVAAKAATCAAEGNVAHWHCSQCDKNFTDNTCATEITDVVIPKTDTHTWNAGTETTPATCTATGVKKFTCTVCNQTKTEDIPKTGHNTNGTVAHKDATCTATGVVGGTYCTVCNNGKADAEKTIPMLPHTEVDDPAVAPTCTATGKTAGKHCSVCGAITKAQETVSMLPHDWDEYQHDQDEHWQPCKNCDAENNREGHNWDGGTTVTEATEYAEGEMLYTCTVCAQTKTESITKLPHTHKWSDEWTHNDYYHWHECTEADLHESEVHGEEFAHDWELSEVLKETTCTETGMGKYVCDVCGAEKTEELSIVADAHDWESWTILLSPTLKTEGTAQRVCTRNSDHTDTVDLPVLTDKTVWTKVSGSREDPTLKDKGSEDYTSEYGTVTLPIPELTDPIWTKVSRTDPTLDDTGSEKYTSTDYGEVTITIPKLTDPIWTKGDRTDPTLDGTGSEKYTSTDYGEVTITIPELTDPIWTKVSRTDPTLDDTGSEKYTSTDYGEVTITIPELIDPIWTKVSRTDPTLDDTGSEKYTSTDYGEVTITIPELTDPIWTKSDRTDPTLDDTGSEKYTSTDYGEVTITIPELTDPIWTKGDRTDPTLDGTGSEKYTSTDYGEVTITIPELTDPIWTKDDSKHVEPTEEDMGKDVYISEYGEVEIILPVKEHTHVWGNWTITTEPTLTATGTAQRVCTKNAEHTDTKTLPALTDTSVWTKVDGKHVDPTEDNDGKDVYTSEYGEVIVVLPALGHTHNWGDWSITVNPTLTETGTAQRVCTLNSTHIDTKTLPVLTDTSVWTKDDTQHVDPTVDNDGKDVYTSEYGEVIVVLPALGHTHIWGDWSITVNPTLTETGTAQRVCTLNNTHIDTKTLPVLTDTSVWTKDDTQHVDPTEDNDGKDVYTSEYGEVVYPLDKLPHTHKFPLTFVPEVKPTEDKEGVKEHWHCDGCGKDFEDEDGTKEVTADNLKIGKIETVVQAPANVPTPEIATPKEELVEATLTEEEQKKVDEGATIKIILKVEDATNTVQSEDKTAVADKLGELTNYKLGQYLDVTLLKKIGEQQEQKIVNTSKPILITFEIPESLRGKSEYSVIRVHGGETTILRDLDSDPNTVTIETDKFSTYALTYKEKTSGGGSHRPTNPDTSDTSDDTSSDTSDNTSSDTSESTSDDTSDNTSSDTSESTSDDTSDNTPSDTSESTSGDTSDSTSSDTSDNTSSSIADSSASDNSSSGESSHIPSESDTSSGDNPATGIAVSLIPLTVAVAVVIAAAKRRHK